MPKVLVLGDCDRILYHTHTSRAVEMVADGQAAWTLNRRGVRLSGSPGEPGHGRTRTSRGGMLAAIGRGQCYTISNRQGQVTGLKSIFPEDRDLFNAATLGAMTRVTIGRQSDLFYGRGASFVTIEMKGLTA